MAEPKLTLTQLQDKLTPTRIAIGQLQILMNNAKVGSDAYIKANKARQIAVKNLADYEAQIAAMKKESDAKKAAAKKIADAKKAADDAQRRADIAGTPVPKYDPKTGASLVPGTDAYNKGSFIRPVQPTKTPAQIKAEQDAADAKKKTDAETKAKAEAAAKAKAEAEAKAAADKTAADKAAADKAAADKTAADAAAAAAKELALKTMYIDYLTLTFSELGGASVVTGKPFKPELDALMAKAKEQAWDAATFQSALEGTSWWQETLPSLRSWYLDTHDPRMQSTTAEKVRNKVASVSNLLEQLGVGVQGIDPTTGKAYDKTQYVSAIAQKAVQNGWSDNQLKDYLATESAVIFTGGGEIGTAISKIRDAAYLYGVNLTPAYEKTINNDLLNPSDGKDAAYYVAEMKRQALENPANSAFSKALESGRTLYDATRAYRTQMAGLLEVDESNVTWDDLMKKTINADGNARTFADFTREVKSDPLWQQTRNAKETYSTNALDMAKMFGLVG